METHAFGLMVASPMMCYGSWGGTKESSCSMGYGERGNARPSRGNKWQEGGRRPMPVGRGESARQNQNWEYIMDGLRTAVGADAMGWTWLPSPS